MEAACGGLGGGDPQCAPSASDEGQLSELDRGPRGLPFVRHVVPDHGGDLARGALELALRSRSRLARCGRLIGQRLRDVPAPGPSRGRRLCGRFLLPQQRGDRGLDSAPGIRPCRRARRRRPSWQRHAGYLLRALGRRGRVAARRAAILLSVLLGLCRRKRGGGRAGRQLQSAAAARRRRRGVSRAPRGGIAEDSRLRRLGAGRLARLRRL